MGPQRALNSAQHHPWQFYFNGPSKTLFGYAASKLESHCQEHTLEDTHHPPALHSLQVGAETEPGSKDDSSNKVDITHKLHWRGNGWDLTPVQIKA